VCNIITTERLEESSHEALFLTPTMTANAISEPRKGDKNQPVIYRHVKVSIFQLGRFLV